MSQEEAHARLALALIASQLHGFQQATQSTIVRTLRNYNPDGQTAMRDAVMIGCARMLKLQELFVRLEVFGIWQFVHVVLTDGEDTASELEPLQLQRNLEDVSSKIPKQLLKQYFIGVGLDNSTRTKLRNISNQANGEYFDIDSNGIESIFHKITISLGLHVTRRAALIETDEEALLIRQEQRQVTVEAQRHRYMIMFSIDGSGSMADSKWASVT
jgi:Mg-chelatase subunit ChlD